MDTGALILNLLIYLGSSVVLVSVFARLGLGSVLGYLFAGMLIGPWGLGFIDNTHDVLELSELGIMLLLFIIGLELDPRRLLAMRRPIAFFGGFQVGLSAILIGGVVMLLGLSWQIAVIIGLAMALSSTAMSLQIINERNLLKRPIGQVGFPVLLFQDLLVVPVLALIPFLSGTQLESQEVNNPTMMGLTVISASIGIFLVSRYALHHIFRFVASTRLPEIFTALSLLLILGLSTIMYKLGLSLALGAFLAGVILADSEYRHALKSDIQPFKGLLLGLFFISVGMNMDFGLLFDNPLIIVTAAFGVLIIKSAVLYVLAIITKLDVSERPMFSFLFSQGGEFAFVLFAFAASSGALEPDLSSKLILVVTLTMMMTPILVILNDKLIEPRYQKFAEQNLEMDEIDHESRVILVGFGRVGQIIGRMLHVNGIEPVVIENDPDHIERVRRFGYKTYYGDLFKHDVLKAVNAEQADMIILTMNNAAVTNQAVELIQNGYPDLRIIARARDRDHAIDLFSMNVKEVTRDTFYSSVEMGKQILNHLGFPKDHIDTMANAYVERDIEKLMRQVDNRDEEKELISIALHSREQLEKTLELDDIVEKQLEPQEPKSKLEKPD
ncbi:MAG: monovalent cation:proton antiporter-2 (CPA2) family protein [Gammaproteobacteria bacterium]|nr:monovalent cation:proton antiporter-2 (CPA2) family protein [Gammaproteobacteria bacterium]MCY4219448.1 monovalent cation:proton antiporter-2 (CPA2) family protein [Gammaproteobacteria bacterium]